jgi:hypothetical protein
LGAHAQLVLASETEVKMIEGEVRLPPDSVAIVGATTNGVKLRDISHV